MIALLAPEANAQAVKEKKTNNLIRLWSIQGLGHDLRAEVIYQEKIIEVSFDSQRMKVGNWLLVGMTEKEIEFSALNKNGKLTNTRLRLKLPQTSEFATIWPNPTIDGMSLTDGTARPPVPLSMLKP